MYHIALCYKFIKFRVVQTSTIALLWYIDLIDRVFQLLRWVSKPNRKVSEVKLILGTFATLRSYLIDRKRHY